MDFGDCEYPDAERVQVEQHSVTVQDRLDHLIRFAETLFFKFTKERKILY